jgi:hypothetical protein
VRAASKAVTKAKATLKKARTRLAKAKKASK